MKIICYYDTNKNRKREFIRLQVRHEEHVYIFEELECKQFPGQDACGEIDRQEFYTEKEARTAYENRLKEL